MKFKAAQEKCDELQARYLDLKVRFLVFKDKEKATTEEHAEYEDVIHHAGGMTVSEVEAKALEVVARCANYQSEYGRNSK